MKFAILKNHLGGQIVYQSPVVPRQNDVINLKRFCFGSSPVLILSL